MLVYLSLNRESISALFILMIFEKKGPYKILLK